MALEKPQQAKSFLILTSTVQGAEVLTVGTDAWVQVVNGVAQAQEGIEVEGLLTGRVEGGEGRGESQQGNPASEASRGTDIRSGSSL